MKQHPVSVIGITGGAGSGKSEVLKIMEKEFGACVIIADEVARNLSLRGQICYENIRHAFGPGVIGEDGELDRKKLAAIVFSDHEKLALLNEMTHPFVRQAIVSEIEQQKLSGTASCIVIEAALLIETGYKNICDELWYVYTSPAIRRQRMKATRGYTDEKIDAIMASQLDEDTFRAQCDRVITNNTTLDDIRMQLGGIMKTL